jgi:hypothetical protein
LAQHIKVYTDEILGKYQGGFRLGHSTTHIFKITQILEKSQEYISLHQLYTDFKQAFDKICHFQITEAMKESGLLVKLISYQNDLVKDTQ